MSIQTQITANSHIYTVVDDAETTYWALITGTVGNEVVAGEFRHGFTVTVDRPGMSVRTIQGGLFCLAGYPELVFPDLATVNYTVNLTVQAPGYRDVSLSVFVPQHTSFPVTAPGIRLRPLPVRVQGRVVDDNTRIPLPGAGVRIDDSAGPPHVVALRWLLHFDHPVLTVVQEQPFSNAGAAKQLHRAVEGGGATITLNDRTALAPGNILRLGPPERVEFGVIETLAPAPTNPAQPGDVTFTAPLRRSFGAGAAVQPVTLGAPGAVRHLVAEANAGDGVVLLDGPLAVDTVAVVEAAPTRVEYGALGALTDPQGFYALDGIGRVPSVGLVASATAHLPKTVPLVVDYDQPVNNVDFRLLP